MGNQLDVSVIICTYNRCDLLPEALESILAQETGGVRYEIIVVDNNSTDRTREVVAGFSTRGRDGQVRYVFEARQGLSHARNTGIAHARAPAVAFTDDDVRVAPDWVAMIKRALDEHPEVDYVGGKVLPRWEREPPAWLTVSHWVPLALADGGDKAFYTSAEKPLCLVGANLSFRREVFDRFGFFTPDFQRVRDGIGSLEDHELQLRLWRAGRRGMYVPEIVVTADVQAERTTKRYHRRWHTGHGRFCAMIRLEEITGPGGRLVENRPHRAALYGVGDYTYRELLGTCAHWLMNLLRGNESTAFLCECRVRHIISYIRQRYRDCARQSRPLPVEVGAFAQALLQGGRPVGDKGDRTQGRALSPEDLKEGRTINQR